MIIPKKIHQLWLNKNIKSYPKSYDKYINTWKIDNYEYKLWNFDECIELIKNNFNEKIYNTFIKIKPDICKCDLARFCIVYIYGGLYVDLNVECLNKNIEFFLKNKEIILYQEPEHHNTLGYKKLFNGIFASIPKNKFIYDWIDKMCDYMIYNNYGSVYSVHYTTGPISFYHFYENYKNKPRLSNFCETLSKINDGTMNQECLNKEFYAIKNWGNKTSWILSDKLGNFIFLLLIIVFILLILLIFIL